MEHRVENLGKKIADPKVGYAVALNKVEGTAPTGGRPGGRPNETPSAA